MKTFLSLTLSILFSLLFVSCAHKENPQERFYYGTLYFQKSGEVKAHYLQVYNMASDVLKSKMRNFKGQRACVILDADETIMDNSPYQGWLYENNAVYTNETWDRWVRSGQAKLLPGVKDFFETMKQLGVTPYILTNRKSYLMDATLSNLSSLGIRLEREQIMGRGKIHSKKERRAVVEKNCKVLLLIGDNLSDFNDDFASKRVQGVFKNQRHFGRDYFILPNPMYGDWIKNEGKEGLEKGKF
jgi:5'-nucleotidase (lipoprotein e(P4) family)